MKWSRCFVFVATLAFALTLSAGAQELPGTHSTAAPPPAKPPATQQQQAPIITVNADLVNMVYSVVDKHGELVPGLKQSDFRVLEDGRPQTINFFSQENALPLTLGLLLDTSPSQTNVLSIEQQVSDQFFHQVITPKDLAFVLGIDDQVRVLGDMTSSQASLTHAIDSAHIGGGAAAGSIVNPGSFPTGSQGGATHLWDAIYLACHDELEHQIGRKAIIVVTDGGEQGSTYTDVDALHAALDSNTIVYAVIAADRSAYGFGGMGPGPEQLSKIVEQTGGRTINTRGGKNMSEAFDAIQTELRTQYTLGYRSDNANHDGKFRAVKIEVPGIDGDKVRARTGYFAGQP